MEEDCRHNAHADGRNKDIEVSFFDAFVVLRPKVVTDDGLSSGGDADSDVDENREHFHHHADDGLRIVGPVFGHRTVFGEHVHRNDGDDDDGDLGEET